MLENLRITKKLPLIVITFALASAMASGLIVYKLTSDQLVRSAENNLLSLVDARKSALQAYFNAIESDLTYHSQSLLVIGAFKEFQSAWQDVPGDRGAYLQDQYVKSNPFFAHQRDAYLDAKDFSNYSRVHARYHPSFRSILATRQFYDLFLVTPGGDLVYSVAKEPDFATNLIDGKWADTDLARVFREANDSPERGKFGYSDFAPFEPSDFIPASFISAPVFDSHSNYLGVLIFEMPINPLNDIMHVTAGLGESGETYLVGKDMLMRSDSRFMKGDSILELEVNTSSVYKALQGHEGVGLINDYRDVPVYSAFGSLDFREVRWAILAEIDQQEVLQPIKRMTLILLVSALLVAPADFNHWLRPLPEPVKTTHLNDRHDDTSV